MSVQDRYTNYLPDQRQHFDELVTEDWGDYSQKEVVGIWRFETDLLFRFVRPTIILDFGCGCGFHDAEMARRPWIHHIDAIDYSSKSIEKARKHFRDPKIDYHIGDFQSFNPSQLYDLVVSFQVIEHLEEPENFIRLCARCCKPGGQVALFTVNRLRPYNRKRMRYGKPPEMEDPMHKQEFSRDELAKMGTGAGLSIQKIFTYAVSSPWHFYRLGLWAGYLFPSQGTRLGAIYRKL